MDERNKGTLLLIDDEEAILYVTQMMLEMRGFSILTANNGLTGIEIFRAHSSEIKAVLIDLVMPYMKGDEVFKELKKIRSDVKVILISGLNRHEILDRFGNDGFASFIAKPYEMEEMLRTVDEIATA